MHFDVKTTFYVTEPRRKTWTLPTHLLLITIISQFFFSPFSVMERVKDGF
jgi:hypothetical protein